MRATGPTFPAALQSACAAAALQRGTGVICPAGTTCHLSSGLVLCKPARRSFPDLKSYFVPPASSKHSLASRCCQDEAVAPAGRVHACHARLRAPSTGRLPAPRAVLSLCRGASQPAPTPVSAPLWLLQESPSRAGLTPSVPPRLCLPRRGPRAAVLPVVRPQASALPGLAHPFVPRAWHIVGTQ